MSKLNSNKITYYELIYPVSITELSTVFVFLYKREKVRTTKFLQERSWEPMQINRQLGCVKPFPKLNNFLCKNKTNSVI